MREKYYLSREQYSKMEAPTLKGTELNMAIKGIHFGNVSKNLLSLHQQARDVDKLGLREHKILLAITRVAKMREVVKNHDDEDKILPLSLTNVPVKGNEDEDKIMAMVNSMATKEGTKKFTND